MRNNGESIAPLLNDRIEAIKAYRRRTGCSLAEANKNEPKGTDALFEYHQLSGFRLSHPDQLYAVRLSRYGRPCPKCEKPFRSPNAHFCAECGFELPDGETAGPIDITQIGHLEVNQKLFSVSHGGGLIGHSRLEFGDPPMGIALGRFIPTEAFSQFRLQNSATEDTDQRIWVGFKVSTENDIDIDCTAVSIIEYGEENDPFDIQVSCLGISYPFYSELFPHHVEGYENSFKF